MSEEIKHDPLLQELARLSPDSAGLQRDEVLFACGRASAPRNRAWKFSATILALLQLASLGAWIHQSLQEPAHATTVILVASPDRPEAVAPSPPIVAADSYGGLVRRWELDDLPPPSAFADPMTTKPTWTIATGQRAILSD